ncbi:hypothetical protein K458DRAFT_443397 [Lentithecium fluviatile CBS 122367]|uniref:Uncharacterized protein n=1 Tax=Lentithecium fluviatile CBS 122367 TaxID=1168545 RepID=A0A6G1IYP2_9PLEO|nr:hypothetical protein K458DRAFT_443397 [Lentithecium fluviatile CBS 122367]
MGAWGYNHNFDLAGDLANEMGFYDMEQGAQVKAKAKAESDDKAEERIHYSIFAPMCFDAKLVRERLDSGVLVDLLPASYLSMLKKVYTEGGLMPDALKQMRKALIGPGRYQNGVPYDFKSKGLLETANAKVDPEPNKSGFQLMNVMSPAGLFSTVVGDSSTLAVIKELRDKHNNPGACGGCGVKNGIGDKALVQCSRCRDRRY